MRLTSVRDGGSVDDMDPTTTYDLMMDSTLSLGERRGAAVSLRDWIVRGGFPPKGMIRDEALRDCAMILHPVNR